MYMKHSVAASDRNSNLKGRRKYQSCETLCFVPSFSGNNQFHINENNLLKVEAVVTSNLLPDSVGISCGSYSYFGFGFGFGFGNNHLIAPGISKESEMKLLLPESQSAAGDVRHSHQLLCSTRCQQVYTTRGT